jgi:hypothetical protein
MSRKLLLRVAAFLTLFTFVGHTFGALSGPKLDQEAAATTFGMMQQTMVPFPFGPDKSIATIMFGANIGLSVYLLLAGLLCIAVSTRKDGSEARDKQVIALNSLGLIAMGVISIFCFFPLPAACTGIAGVLGLVALKK